MFTREKKTMASLSTMAAFIVAVVCVAPAPAPAQELLQDARLGIKLKAPDGFTKVPLKPDEQWIVARWISDRAYYQNDKSGFSVDHKPELNVIAFPSDKVKEKVDVVKSGTGEQSTTTFILKNPFKDYRDYLKRTYNDGGFFIAKEDKAEVEGIAVECLEIKVEKMTFGGPRKIVTWIFKNDDADFAIQFELVENAWSKLKGDVTSCMRSFRRIPKDGKAAPSGPTLTENPFEKTGDMTPAQRAARRRESEVKTQEKFTKGLPDGWFGKKYGRVLVLSHVDDKYAAKVAESANAVLDYLDQNFGYVGPGEYVRAPVVRICKDYDEYHVYWKGGGGFWSFDRELITYKDSSSLQDTTNNITRDCCEHWFREHDLDLYNAMPAWLEIGLGRCFYMSRAKGGKLDFFNDSWERVGMNQQVRSGKLSKIQDLVKMDPDTLRNDQNRYDECAAVARYFMTGPKKAKETLHAYLNAIGVIARRDEEEEKKKVKQISGGSAKTVEEEDAKFKEQRTKMRDAEKAHLEEVYKSAFGTWTDADWKSLQSSYEKSLG
jgi:hypothetical protein